MVIKDFVCEQCGSVRELAVAGHVEAMVMLCDDCADATPHYSACNGGTGRRWRCNDWSGFDPTGYVEYQGVKAGVPAPEAIDTPHESASAEPVTDANTGQVIHELPRFQADAVDERRKQRRFAQDKAKNKTPIWSK